jgi:hypothetical protein
MSAASVLHFRLLTPPTRWNRMMRGLLLDLEGVLYQSGEPIAGAADAVRALAAAGLKIRYLTNTTTQPRRAIVGRLGSMGFRSTRGTSSRHLQRPVDFWYMSRFGGCT